MQYIKGELNNASTKNQVVKIQQFIGSNKQKFDCLIQIMLGTDLDLAKKAAWVASHCVDAHADLINPYISQLVNSLSLTLHPAILRNITRMLSKTKIPKKNWGKLVDFYLQVMSSRKVATAPKVFAIDILLPICKSMPDLKHELKLIMEEQLPYASIGLKNKMHKTISSL